jgi:hypothetical protein
MLIFTEGIKTFYILAVLNSKTERYDYQCRKNKD